MKKQLIVCLPVAGNENPYQQLMMEGLNASEQLMAMNGVHDRFFGIIRSAFRYRPNYIHFDWIAPYYYRRWTILTLISIPLFFLQIWIVKWLLGTAIVWTLHNIYPHDIRCFYLHRHCQQLFAQQCDWIRVFGHETAVRASIEFKIPEWKFKIIPEGDYSKVYPNHTNFGEARRNLSIPETSKVLLYIGLIKPYKGIHHLLSAFKNVCHPNCLLVIAGAVKDDNYQKRLIENISESTTFVPHFIRSEELQYYFQAANIVVLPYLKVENSGSVIMAMGFKKPIIAPNMGTIRERLAVQPELLFDHIDQLESKISYALSLPDDILASIGLQNRQMLEKYQWTDFQSAFS